MLVQGAIAIGSALLASALLAASAPVPRALPSCDSVPAAQRERVRLAGRCAGSAPIINVAPRASRAPVPDLRGRLFDRHDVRVARYVIAVDYRESAQRRDWVLDQMPRPPAALNDGGEIRLVLSDGTLVRVPNVRGGFARALALLHRAGLSWSVNDDKSGPVIAQVPAPGAEVRRGTQVALRLGPLALAPESTRPEVTPQRPRPPTAPPTAPAAPSTTDAPTAATPSTRPAGATMAVPDVQGMLFDAARERLNGLTIQRVHRAGTEPGGTVIGQSPAAGTAVAPGSSVRIVLSDGSLVRVPRVMSFALSEARQRLASGELRVVVNNVAGDAPAGTVLSQRPAEGQVVARGTTVRINVSSGPPATASIAVPNIVGAPFERAQQALRQFRIERSERGAREPAGIVLEQIPAAGTSAPAGSVVSVVVSSGGRPESIEVPNVVAQSADEAVAALSEFRIERETVASVEPAGRVLSQQPAPGTSIAPGSAVALRISDGSLVRVPTLTQRTLGQARADAQASALTISVVEGDADDQSGVRQQQPAPGTEVARGSAVQLTVEPRGFVLPATVRETGQQIAAQIRQLPPYVFALLAAALLLLLALITRRRRPAPLAPEEMVEPVLAEPRANPAVAEPAVAEPAVAEPAVVEPAVIEPAVVEPAVLEPVVVERITTEPVLDTPASTASRTETKEARRVSPVATPPTFSARARLESDPASTIARGALPRGPEIAIAARLDAGAYRVSEAGGVRNEVEEAK